MHNKIINYFSALENKTTLNQLMTYINKSGYTQTNDSVNRYLINDIGYFTKKTNNKQSAASIASARMYQNSGILTPQIYLIKPGKNQTNKSIQKDATTIDNIISVLAKNVIEYTSIDNIVSGKHKWDIFYDEALYSAFLNFMTPQCLENYTNMFLNDEIRTDTDRHSKNYFLFKSPESEKYEGVIAIDLENMIIYNYCGTNKNDFNNFLCFPYSSETPQKVQDYKCYLQRVRDIRQLIQDDVLFKGNIDSLKQSLSYDLPKEIKKVSKEQGSRLSDRKQAVAPIERLWEYNQKTIGKDLGL